MTYRCFFPKCEYETEHRSKIDFHHITPKEIRPTKITIPLCKNHHAMIFHPLVKFGQHSIKTEESLEIIGLYDSTHGKAVHYKDMDGKTFFYVPFDQTIILD